MQHDLSRREHHIKELEETLIGKKDDLAAKVNELTKRNMKLERSMQAKQVFSEKLLKENKKLTDISKLLTPDRQKTIVSGVKYSRTYIL